MNNKVLNRGYKMLAVVVVLAITSLACSLSPVAFGNTDDPGSTTPVQVLPQQDTHTVQLPAAVTDEQGVLISLYEQINPSVVNISTYSRMGTDLTALSQGSGFVYDNQGHIVTNAHVVAEADDLDVIFWNNTIVTGKVIGLDLDSDLAVVEVDQIPQEARPLTLASTDSLAVGQTVVAIGNPYGLDGTLTRGIISALGRNIPALTDFSIPKAIQTDAAINPGNSGGPLLNLQGEVVGVNAQIETGGTGRANTGVGFAIPSDVVALVVPDLISKGSHDWAWLGVRGGTLTVIQAQAMQLEVQNGAYVSEVLQGGPASAAGFVGSTGTATVDGRQVEVGGDVITAIDGQPVSTFDDILSYIMLKTGPGKTVTLDILRNGQSQQVEVELQARPDRIE